MAKVHNEEICFDDELFSKEENELLKNSEVYQTMEAKMSEFGGGDPNNAELNDSQLFEMIMALLNKFYECEENSPEHTQFFGMIMVLIDEFRGDEDIFYNLVMEKASDEEAVKLEAFLDGVDRMIEEEVEAGNMEENSIAGFLKAMSSPQREE